MSKSTTTSASSEPLVADTTDWIERELARVDEASARGRAQQATEPHAVSARYEPRRRLVTVELSNGALFSFPPRLAQGLADARIADLSEIEVSPAGTLLRWPRLDVALGVQNLLAGIFGSRWWMRELAARAGRTRSAARAAASRANGAKGGRPRKAESRSA